MCLSLYKLHALVRNAYVKCTQMELCIPKNLCTVLILCVKIIWVSQFVCLFSVLCLVMYPLSYVLVARNLFKVRRIILQQSWNLQPSNGFWSKGIKEGTLTKFCGLLNKLLMGGYMFLILKLMKVSHELTYAISMLQQNFPWFRKIHVPLKVKLTN